MGKYYGKRVLQEFMNPKNVGIIEDADLVISIENPICGEDSPPSPCMLKLYLKLKDDKIEEAKYKIQGCVAGVAFQSVLSERIKGKSLKEVLSFRKEEILKELEGGIPDAKLLCPFMDLEKLKESLNREKQ